MNALTDTEVQMLEFEKRWWKYAGAKVQAIREAFDCSPTVYYARLHALIDRPDVMAHDPMTVRRLQRLRDARRQARSARRVGYVGNG